MIEIKPMDESFILIDCLHGGPVDPSLPPSHSELWQEAPDLPPHPWSDEVIADLAAKYKRMNEGYAGDPAREFMREMIQRYGSCAMLAWEGGKVVGHLRFYPLEITHLLEKVSPPPEEYSFFCSSRNFPVERGVLWVQCIETTRPYFAKEGSASLTVVTPQKGPDVVKEASGARHFRTAEEAGARKGLGQKLVRGLIDWAHQNEWKRVVKLAHADVDYMYGIYGGGGKAFWEKAGFRVVGQVRQPTPTDERWRTIVEIQAQEKGMSAEEAWMWYRMVYEL